MEIANITLLMNRLMLRKLKKYILYPNFIFVTLFLLFAAGCQKNQIYSSPPLTRGEKKDLEYFLKLLLFDRHGAFVLFGSKPLCEMGYFDTDKDTGRSLFRRNPAKGWKSWRKIKDQFSNSHYILALRGIQLPESGEEYKFVVFADIEKTALVLAENYEIFKNCSGMDFHPLEIVFDLENPDSIFWNRVFALESHLPKGLLYGFGKKNALLFAWERDFASRSGRAAEYLKNQLFTHSTKRIKVGAASSSHFEIPLFGAPEGDEMTSRYRKEKSEIEKIYRGKDFLKTTLQQLEKKGYSWTLSFYAKRAGETLPRPYP